MLTLVTGSTGFIGSQLCRALVEDGQRVRAFHRPASPLANLHGLPVEHASGDITQPETLQAAMQGVEVVFHVAAHLGKPYDRNQMHAVTVGGTRNVLQAAAGAGVRRVVHTSSVAALGVPDNLPAWGRLTGAGKGLQPLLMDECHTWNYRPEWWPYGYTKYLAELEVQEAVARGLDVVIVNPSVVVGAGDLNRISGNVIIQVARRHVPVSVPGGLNAVHITDVVRGHLAALTSGRTGERYILGGENMPHRQFLQIVAGVAGVPAPRLALPGWLARGLAGPLSLANRFFPLPFRGDALRRAAFYFYYETLKAKMELGLSGTLPARQAVEEAYTWYMKLEMI